MKEWFEETNNTSPLTDVQIREDSCKLPIDCNCGCTDTEERDVVWLDGVGSTKCEYSEYCVKCGRYLGSFAYGHWEY